MFGGQAACARFNGNSMRPGPRRETIESVVAPRVQREIVAELYDRNPVCHREIQERVGGKRSRRRSAGRADRPPESERADARLHGRCGVAFGTAGRQIRLKRKTSSLKPMHASKPIGKKNVTRTKTKSAK